MEKLDLVDVSIHEKDWKQFRKSATQEELLVLAIGVKYSLISSRILTYISALGIVLSIVLGLTLFMFGSASVGLIVLVGGYLVFSFLSTKSIRYSDSLGKITGKLDKKNKEYIKSIFKVSGVAAFFDGLTHLAIMFLTIPYQAVLLLIGMFAPNFVIAKNGVLISIPKGYDIGNLASIGEYYASFSLLGDMQNTSYENNHKYEGTFVNEKGCEQKVHSADGKSFYSEDGTYVGQSEDGGKTINLK